MRFIRPDGYYVSVLDIDPQALVDKGYKAVLLDLDNTLQPRDAQGIPASVAIWVHSLTRAGLKVALLSNSTKGHAVDAAGLLGVPLVQGAFKPLSRGYVKACALLGVACSQAVMIGDQSYTDILGAHRVGMDGLLVMPQAGSDPIHTHLLRAIDRRAVRGMRASGGNQ